MSLSITTNPVRRFAGVVTLILGVLLALLPLSPAAAIDVIGEPGPPRSECAGLVYLDKFDMTEFTFDVGETSGPVIDATDGSLTYSSTTGVTVTFLLDEGESHEIAWTSTTPVDRVWTKAGRDTDVGVVYDEATSGTETVEGNAFSHITFCYDEDEPEDPEPSVEVTTECVEGTSTITVIVDNDGDEEFEVDVLIDDVYLETISETTSYSGYDANQVLSVYEAGGSQLLGSGAFEDCSVPEPSVEVTTECVEGTSTITVIVDNDGDEQYAVDVLIDDVYLETITETTSYSGYDADQVLSVYEAGGSTLLGSGTFEDCSEPVDPTWELTGECLEAVVTITNPDEVEFELEIRINGESQTITETTEFVLEPGDVLEVWEPGDDFPADSFTAEDCSEVESSVDAAASCDGTDSTVTVTITYAQATGARAAAVAGYDVYIDGEYIETITETTTYNGSQGQVLEVRDGEGVVATAEFPLCEEPVESTVAFTTGTECAAGGPAVTYSVTFAQGDEPITSATLLFTDAAGAVLDSVTVTEDATGSLTFAGYDGEDITVTLDWDSSSQLVTLDDCEEVLGVRLENDPTPDPAPAPEVEATELANAGITSSGFLLLALGLIALGLGLLVLDERERGVQLAI